MAENAPPEPLGDPQGADAAPVEDLSTPDGYMREIERRYRVAAVRHDSASADRLLALIGKMRGHFDEPEPTDPMADDLAKVTDLVKRLVASGKIDPSDLGLSTAGVSKPGVSSHSEPETSQK